MRTLPFIFCLLCLAAPAEAAPTPVFRALFACIASGHSHLDGYSESDGTQKWGVSCEGSTASQVWTALYPHRVSEQRKKRSDNSEFLELYIGRQSYCMKDLAKADGTAGQHIECNLFLDLDDAIAKDIRSF
jgi:hypothetical protein